uniref:Uncharacterized protein n=1 Tax=Pseudomonas fluorescens TaxID=294 RepID=A0A5E6REK4_PSEFL|nr:hypothetical protein PS652_01489 [Pseudomonas fluorescens]
MGPGGAQPDQVGAQAIDTCSKAALGNLREGLIIQGNLLQAFTGAMAAFTQSSLGRCPLRAERFGIAVEIQAPANDLATGLWQRLAFEHHVQAKAIEQLRAQLALLRVHGANQHETGAVAVGDTVTLDPVGATGGHVQQQVDQMIRQKIDFIHIQHAAIGLGQHPGRKLRLALAQRRIQVEGTDQAFFTGAQRQGHEWPLTEQIGQAAGQGALGHAARTFDQHAADLRVNGRQAQRQFQLIGADHGGQGEVCRFAHLNSLLRRPAVVLPGLHGSHRGLATARVAGLRAGVR